MIDAAALTELGDRAYIVREVENDGTLAETYALLWLLRECACHPGRWHR